MRRAALLAVVACLLLAASERPLVSPERVGEHVRFLASPALKGRMSGTPELDRAARYIADYFRAAGLQPAVCDAKGKRSYYQDFQVTVGAKLGRQNRAAVRTAAGSVPLKLEKDYTPLNFSDSGQATLPVLFAGYGITAAEHNYDDYAHLDANGKAVIVLSHEPQEDNEKSVFDGRGLTTHATVTSKAINARNHGARAMIFVNDPVPHAGEEDRLLKLGSVTGPENAGLLVIHARGEVVERWLQPFGKTLAQLQSAIDESLKPQSFALDGVELHLAVDVQRLRARTRNVAGLLPGSDAKLREECVVLGAHYDHLGLGFRNSLAPQQTGQVHPGADDNASGTAGLLELARELAARKQSLKRSILFLAFSAEELGLLGSAHYTKQPLVPLEKTVAMLNLDMVGRPRDGKLTVGGADTSPIFREVLARANTVGLTVSYSSSGFGSSDHQSFYTKNIPVLFFFSGLHADYHKPSDTADRIQTADLARVATLALNVAQELARREERPAFVKLQEPQAPVGGGAGYGAYFGSIPDMGEEVRGVKFADVRPGSPAAQAGLRAGDILVQFAGKEITNLYDFTYALRAHKPGEEVQVTVLRGSERLTVTVKLAQRR